MSCQKAFEVFTLGVKGNGELISRGLRQKNKKEVQGFCAILLFLELVLISDNVRFGAAFLKCGISAFIDMNNWSHIISFK
jgi:hypothetical protein